MGHTWKSGSHLDKWVTLEKNDSYLQKWVTLEQTGHTLKNGLYWKKFTHEKKVHTQKMAHN